MANVLFKRGLQANIPANGSAQDGVFYLTSDTNRLYIGQGTNAVLLNKVIKTVTSISALQAESDAWSAAEKAAHVDDFYYISDDNILAVFGQENSAYKWIQINKNTDTTNSTLALAAAGSAGAVSVYSSIKDSDNKAITATMAVAGASGVSVSASSNGALIISGTEYSLGAEVASATQLDLQLSNGSTTQSIGINAIGGLSFTANGATIAINSIDTTLQSVTFTAATGSLAFTLTDTENTPFSATATNVGIGLNDGNYVPIINTTSSTANVGAIYSKDEIDVMINGLDGMTYRGTLGSSGTNTVLPTSNIKNGDVYVIVESDITTTSSVFVGTSTATFETATIAAMSSGAKIGDMLIAKGTEGSNGFITSDSLKWTYIPAGNDSLADVTYSAIVDTANNSIKIKNDNNIGVAKIVLSAGADVSLSSAVGTDGNVNDVLTTTISHATITTTVTNAATLTGSSATFTAVKAISTSNGHVVSIETDIFTPVTYELTGVTATVTSSSTTSTDGAALFEIGLKDSDNAPSGNPVNLYMQSDTLKFATSTANNGVIVNLTWGTF